ncbi:hypothetical protein [Caulobacter soli]|uniref:hypothetical protein n=1 Tax=Caulobacter soli TaxID=2708539 RepID=UPI0013ED46E1|nr:hypothetical protein [Caulobacter soli]
MHRLASLALRRCTVDLLIASDVSILELPQFKRAGFIKGARGALGSPRVPAIIWGYLAIGSGAASVQTRRSKSAFTTIWRLWTPGPQHLDSKVDKWDESAS